MKLAFTTIAALLFVSVSTAQNVGIGTTTPVNKLSVVGKVNITDSLGIGTTAPASVLHLQSSNMDDIPRADIILSRYWNGNSDTRASSIFHYNNTTSNSDNLAFAVAGNGGSFDRPNTLGQIKMVIQANGKVGIGTTTPAGEFHVRSANIPNGNIDQQQTVATNTWATQRNWQSFTAGVTGYLTKVDLGVGSPNPGGAQSGIINIFNGEGTNGTPLSTTNVVFQPVQNTTQSFPLNSFVFVTAGNVYTIEFDSYYPFNGQPWVLYSGGNLYPGGRANIDLNSQNWDFFFRTYVISEPADLLVVNDGGVSIGSSSPNNRLTVIGNSDITGNLGIGTTTPANKLSVNGNSDISGNLGIGTTTPVTNLDVNGGIRTRYSGSAIFDVVGGAVRALSITIPALPVDWSLGNTVVIVSNADGVDGIVRQARLSSATSIDVKYYQDVNGPVRLNWIIFRF